MRILDDGAKNKVNAVIKANWDTLSRLPGFVSAEPGFPIVDGQILREPAIIVHVVHKKPDSHLDSSEKAPRQIGLYRVSVMQADPMLQLMNNTSLQDLSNMLIQAADVGGLTYSRIADDPINQAFVINTPILCHVGPDAGWPTLKPFIEATESTLSVAIYDFNADYIAKTFIDTVKTKGIKAILTWDDGMTPAETAIRTRLKVALKGDLDGWVVKCGSGYRFASAYHEKVAVRDSKAFWLSSGNWSTRSQPEIDPIADPKTAKGMYSRGNREWHVIVEDEPLSKVFERYITYDRDGSAKEAEEGDKAVLLDYREQLRFPDVFVTAESALGGLELATAIAEPVSPSALPAITRPVTVYPVLTPDNYLDRINELLASAEHSVYLQFAYINYSDDKNDTRFTDLLKTLADLSYKAGMDVKIIVGSNGAADKIRKLAENGFNAAVFRSQGNIHNKGIIVDGARVLVSSTNWSSDGVLRNRDAGLIIDDAEIAGYFQTIFLDDWESRAHARLEDDPPVILAADGVDAPAGMVRKSMRDYYE